MELEISGAEPLTTELIDRVDRARARAEDDGMLVVRLGSGSVEWPGKVDVHLVGKWEQALRKLERVPATTIAIASGGCAGAAAELLLVTDYRLAAPGFRLHLHPWPGMALYRLVVQAGAARARRLALFGGELDASEAASLGLIDEIADNPDAAITELKTLAGKEIAIRRRLMLDAGSMQFEEALGAHLAACDRYLRAGEAE
ncbi:hypothetical protein Lesp02_00170 [Lentzea sp. NBRC 105346]|nr:hypothetical protein Lesp02_00170 [Lentzea sp. NBRC 105346]